MSKNTAPTSPNLMPEQEERLHDALDLLVRFFLRNLQSEHQKMSNPEGKCLQEEVDLVADSSTSEQANRLS